MKRVALGVAMTIVFLSAAACGLATPSSPTDVVPDTPSITAEVPTPQPLVSTPVPGACPIPAGAPGVPALGDLSSLASDLLEYLDAGGSLEALHSSLAQAGLFSSEGLGWVEGDLTGDGLNDVALSVLDPASTSVPPSGALFFYVCMVNSYALAYASPASSDTGAPLIHAAQDLNGDGPIDLLVGFPTCGAHTCQERAEVLLWSGTALENRMAGTSEDLPTPTLELVGPEADGSFRIAITATGIGSVGAGPFRPLTRTWNWDPQSGAFTITGEVLLPSHYRIHVLQDADRAAKEGDPTTAMSLYYRVITDDTLDGWLDPVTEQANLTAYAMFRHMVMRLVTNDLGDAQVGYGILQNGYPTGSVGHAYAVMAQAFWEVYTQTADLAAGCTAAQDYATAHAAEVLEPLYFGYANPVYTASDLCPYGP